MSVSTRLANFCDCLLIDRGQTPLPNHVEVNVHAPHCHNWSVESPHQEKRGRRCAARSTGRESVPFIALPATGMQAQRHLPEPTCFLGNCDARFAGLGFRGFPSADRRTHQGQERTERATESAPLLHRTAVGQVCGVPSSVAQYELIFNVCLQRGRDAQGGNDATLLCCRRESGQ